jgi:hypothetical protein
VPNPSDVRRSKGLLRHSLHQSLQIDLVRYGVARARYAWYVGVRRGLRTLEGQSAVAEHTVTHNLRGLHDLAVVRSLALVRPLSVLEELRPDARILVVGPRTEGELLALVGLGFDPARIRGLDLISYSPWIDLGDMHDLPYDDACFDAVVAGWVLAYSDDMETAGSELLRVVRPGGVVAVGVEWNRRSNAEIVQAVGYVPGAERRIESTQDIIDLLGTEIGEVVLRTEGAESADGVRSLIVVVTRR